MSTSTVSLQVKGEVGSLSVSTVQQSFLSHTMTGATNEQNCSFLIKFNLNS